MKVEVEKIKDGAEFTLSENISAATWELDSYDIEFVDDIAVKCEFHRYGDAIVVNVKTKAKRVITCSRCLKKTEQIVNDEFDLDYNIPELTAFLEIDPDIREQLLLNSPMRILCRPDCKGVCSCCGVDLNSEECKCKQSNQKPEDRVRRTENGNLSSDF